MPTRPCHYVKCMFGIFDLQQELLNYCEQKSDYSSKISIEFFFAWGKWLLNSCLMHKDLIFIFLFSEWAAPLETDNVKKVHV